MRPITANDPKNKSATNMATILRILRDGKMHVAEDIAFLAGCHVRTVYRHVAAARQVGWEIKGDKGCGYMLRERGKTT